MSFDPSAVAGSHYVLGTAALLGCLVLYLLYKVAWPRDFGVPVRRRLFCRRLRMVRDQLAIVPLWWSDIQIQRAVRAHWRETLQRGLPGSPALPHAPGPRG